MIKQLLLLVSLILIASNLHAEIIFKMGVEYAWNNSQNTTDGKGLPEVYADMGATLTKPQDEQAYMQTVQKDCGGPFDWTSLDDRVKRWQSTGFDLLVVLATKYDKEPSKYTPEEVICYQEYVRATVERYNLNNIADMPGLIRPILYWQVDSEFGTGFFDKRDPVSASQGLDWKDPGGEYVKMLEMATPIIRKTSPNAKVLTISWQTRGLWTDVDGEKRVYANKDQWQKIYDQNAAHIFKALSRPDLFDITCFNSIEDWSAIVGITRFCRDVMKAHGYEPKPIWASDLSYSLDPMMTFGTLLYPYHGNVFDIFSPTSMKRYWKTFNLLGQMAQTPNPHEAWVQELQSSFTAKAIVTAIGEGVGAMNIHATYSNDFPWKFWTYRIGGGTFGWCGLIETDFSKGGMPKQPKAVFYTIKELWNRIKSYDRVECRSTERGSATMIHRYDFFRGTDRISILWYDNRLGRFPDEPIPKTSYTVNETEVSEVAITPIPVRIGNTTMEAPVIHGKINGKITLDVMDTPIILEYRYNTTSKNNNLL